MPSVRRASSAPPFRATTPLAACALLCAALGLPAASQAQVSAREQKALEFGLIAAGQTTGTVTLLPSGGSVCGPHTCLGGQQAARFRVSGPRSAVIDIGYSSGDVLNHASSGATLQIGNFSDDAGGTLHLNPGGQGRLRIGADLTLGPFDAGGSYSGTYTVIFNLQ